MPVTLEAPRAHAHPQKLLSVRLLWPFIRVAKITPDSSEVFARAGIRPGELSSPTLRVGHRTVMDLLAAYVERTGDATIGLRAGEAIEPGDLDVVEYVARSCATLRDAIARGARYVHLMHEAIDTSLVDEDGRAQFRFRMTDDVAQVPAANDFVVATALAFARLHAPAARGEDGSDEPLEVHLMHAVPTDAATYRRLFGPNVRLGMPHNAVVFPSALLDAPMRSAHPFLRAAFEAHARELSDRAMPDMRTRVRELVTGQLSAGAASMGWVARALAMSVPTLRRRLEGEGTTFSDLLDSIRQELAESYLRDPRLSVSEIAFLLGFSHAPAFHKAFKRWKNGATPSAYRAPRASAPA